jgi:hypothetical protein
VLQKCIYNLNADEAVKSSRVVGAKIPISTNASRIPIESVLAHTPSADGFAVRRSVDMALYGFSWRLPWRKLY